MWSNSLSKNNNKELKMKDKKEELIKQPHHKWQNQGRYVGPKRQNKVTMEIFMDPQIREDIKALAVTQGLSAQELVEKLIINTVGNNRDFVEEGTEILKQTNGNTTSARLKYLQERIANSENNENPQNQR